jgi:hypothetical protein
MATEIETDTEQVASRTTLQRELRILISICRGQNCAARVHFAIKGLLPDIRTFTAVVTRMWELRMTAKIITFLNLVRVIPLWNRRY